jgi:hypothetical protein
VTTVATGGGGVLRPTSPLGREAAQVLAAIYLVAEGRAPSVVVSNLAGLDRIFEALRGVADSVQVRLELLPRPDGRGSDIAVRGR